MKKNMKYMFVMGVLLSMIFTGCSSNASGTGDSGELKSQMESLKKEVDALKEENEDLKEQIGKNAEQAYGDIVSDLESGNFDEAIDKIDQIQKDKMAAEAGDVNDYLVSVDLTADNFDEYFEFASEPQYNEFGEKLEGVYSWGLNSLKYDEGLIIYDMDDIVIEYNAYGDGKETTRLSQLLYFGRGYSEEMTMTVNRMTEGKVVFIKDEYIKSYDVDEESFNYNGWGDATIILKNGEEIYRSMHKNHPY